MADTPRPTKAEDRPPKPTPWRVEGERPQPEEKGAIAGMRPPGGRRFWLLLLLLFLANWFVVSQFAAGPKRLEVPYTVFREQLDAGNVGEIRSRGEDIQGEFKKEVTYPAGNDGTTSKRFMTVRPSFAEDNLYEELVQKGVVVSA